MMWCVFLRIDGWVWNPLCNTFFEQLWNDFFFFLFNWWVLTIWHVFYLVFHQSRRDSHNHQHNILVLVIIMIIIVISICITISKKVDSTSSLLNWYTCLGVCVLFWLKILFLIRKLKISRFRRKSSYKSDQECMHPQKTKTPDMFYCPLAI